MSSENHPLWHGLTRQARARLQSRNYSKPELPERVCTSGAEAAELIRPDARAELDPVWIPGVEIFHRPVYQQRHRGWFGEFARQHDPASPLARIGMWPQQWATALMFAGTAKGFHIHPPAIPPNTSPEAWFRRLFLEDPDDFSLRPYSQEQWDVMFFVQGTCEMFLLEERPGLPRRRLRFIIEGDNRPGPNNVGVIIPPGVAHALRSASSQDLIMVYGTSTQFIPDNEGRIASEVENPDLVAPWENYFFS
jgi:dTDP-4-dehydrorhamnose 3,5-epimerase-like enzyme